MSRKRRGRGEGGIYQRESDGLWVGSVSFGYTAEGKRNRRTVYGRTKREVQAKLDQLRADAKEGVLTGPTKLTLAGLLSRWLEDEVRPNREPATVECYEGVINKHVLPALGGVRVDQLGAAVISNLFAKLKRNGVGDRTRQLTHSVLSRAYKVAVRQKWDPGLRRSPMGDVDRPALKPRRATVPTAEQVRSLLESARGHRLEALFYVAALTGLRQGEQFGLRWQDVDLEAGVLHVRHSLEDLGKEPRLKDPKSANGVRVVELPASALAALAAQRARALAEGRGQPDRPVFTDRKGGWLRKHSFYKVVVKPMWSTAGLPASVRWHDLRHFTGSWMTAAGVDPKTLMGILGHGDVTTTMKFYVHPDAAARRAAAAKMDSVLNGHS